jgi:NAD(P)H dehydrogenase (quinone)
MLRNSIYMDGIVAQAEEMIATGRAAVPANESPIAYVTRADCAAAAAAAVSAPGHRNRIYDITGPELVGTREIAEAASAVSGREIAIVPAGPDSPAGFGTPSTRIVSTHVEDLTGRRPTSVAELLAASLTGR